MIYVFTILIIYLTKKKKRLSSTVTRRIWHEQPAYNKRVQGGVKVQAMMQRAYPRICYAINQHAQFSRRVCGQRSPPPSINQAWVYLMDHFGLSHMIFQSSKPVNSWFKYANKILSICRHNQLAEKNQPSTRCHPHLAPQPGRRGSMPRATWGPSVSPLDQSSKCPGEGRPRRTGRFYDSTSCFLVGLASGYVMKNS